jgi:hypothetical protein
VEFEDHTGNLIARVSRWLVRKLLAHSADHSNFHWLRCQNGIGDRNPSFVVVLQIVKMFEQPAPDFRIRYFSQPIFIGYAFRPRPRRRTGRDRWLHGRAGS